MRGQFGTRYFAVAVWVEEKGQGDAYAERQKALFTKSSRKCEKFNEQFEDRISMQASFAIKREREQHGQYIWQEV
jgi:hypothetical protein